MTDYLSKSIKESGEKSAFVCVSCHHHNIPDSEKTTGKPLSPVKDHLTEAVKESGEKSAFVCKNCGHVH